MKTLFAFCILIFSNIVYAAPKAELWAYWQASNDSNTASISHQAWQSILDRNLVQVGENALFRYAEVTKENKTLLNDYLDQLSKLDPREFNRQEQYAYWVNLYNALTVKLILDNYPVASITKLGGLFSFGPWDEKVFTVAGQTLTLNDIEHRILRPIWKDPRTHYAVNCASLGCPNLQSQAFTAQNTEQLLSNAAHAFINSSKGATLNNDTLILSSIYDWFAVDFGNKEDLLIHLAQYRPELSLYSGKIDYQYDWKLNNAKEKK
ncbi:Ser/Thr protein kinase [Vibrio cholerae]|nr:Ser/Thr protein kinase [Vibrio cholerae]